MPEDFNDIMLYEGQTISYSTNQTDIPIISSFTILDPASNSLEISGVSLNNSLALGDHFVVTLVNATNHSIILKHNIGTTPFFTSGGADYTLAPNSFVVAIYVLNKFLIKTT